MREKARIEFKTAKRMKKEAKEMNSQMNDAVEAQKAAVDAVTKNASAEKLALMKAAEEAKYAALHQAEQKRRSDKALQKAIAKVSPESSPDHSPLRRKKHAKSIATTHAETVVGGAAVLKIVDQKKAADIALARAEDAIAVALMNRADDGDRFEAFAETLNATNTKAHEEIVLRQMAEERAEELERKILELKEELTAAMEYKKHWQKSEQRIKDEQKGFEKVLYEERAVKFDALEKLRGAMKAREKIRAEQGADARDGHRGQQDRPEADRDGRRAVAAAGECRHRHRNEAVGRDGRDGGLWRWRRQHARAGRPQHSAEQRWRGARKQGRGRRRVPRHGEVDHQMGGRPSKGPEGAADADGRRRAVWRAVGADLDGQGGLPPLPRLGRRAAAPRRDQAHEALHMGRHVAHRSEAAGEAAHQEGPR